MYIGRKGNHILGQELTKKKKDREQQQQRLSEAKSAPNEQRQYSSPKEKADHPAQAL
jgi:hypothetical protein